jgi:hypothetical protein
MTNSEMKLVRRASKYTLKGFRRNEDFVNELVMESLLTTFFLDCRIKWITILTVVGLAPQTDDGRGFQLERVAKDIR